jgi:hypothetical protein
MFDVRVPSFSGAREAQMSGLVDRRAGRSKVYQGALGSPLTCPVEPLYGVALLDRHGGLLGAGATASLPGEVEVPPGVDLRARDVRCYLGEDRGHLGGRRFPLVSATWVSVKSKRVRIGIYMESGERHITPDQLDPDLGAIAAILSAQVA